MLGKTMRSLWRRFWVRKSQHPTGQHSTGRCRLRVEELEPRLTPSEVGVNDFRISNMGPDGKAGFGAGMPAVAYNSTDNQFLVVWSGNDTGDLEIFGQLLDAATGAALGPDFRISDMGPDGDGGYFAADPAVAYNGANNQFLVVWWGNDNTAPLVDGECEIFGQRLDAAGEEVGANDFRISHMGPDGDAAFDALLPRVAYNGAGNQYMVVWSGDETTDSVRDIFGQRLDGATGIALGGGFPISDLGAAGDINFEAEYPDLAYNSANNEYLVVWHGRDKYGEVAIVGQRLDAATGAPRGANDFRISDMGPKGSSYYPAVAYNAANNEYLVVWEGEDDTAPLIDNEIEIFGQRLDGASGTELGVNDFRISNMGPDGSTGFPAASAAVAYNASINEYLVVWHGNDNTPPLAGTEVEIYGQRLDANPAAFGPVGVNDFRISDMGPDGVASFEAREAALASNSRDNQFLVVWHGNDDIGPKGGSEVEIFGQRLVIPLPPVPVAVRPVRAVLRNFKVGGKTSLFVVLIFEDTGLEKRRFKSPLRKPTYKQFKVALLDADGDGLADLVVLTAKRGAKTVKRFFVI
ncbi:MAG: hypothetical protein L0Y71_18005 [Gemmataceae bacterium]|nr:hypothetical protein [Gemmataceae bacterium]